MNKEFPADGCAFIHIYGDLSYAREAGIAPRLFFLAFCHHQLFRPIEFYFRSVGRSMRREFGDHKYRNGHGSPLKDAGEGWNLRRDDARRSASSRSYRRESRWPCEPIPSLRFSRRESIKNTWLPGKSYFALLFNKTAEERTETVRHCDKHSRPSATHGEYILPRVAHWVKSNLLDGFRETALNRRH